MSNRAHIISVIPVYNGERFLTATLDSLAAQTLKPDRVIVLDDASTDDTAKLVEAYQPLKCELVRSKQNEGLFNNFNRALGFATECDFMHYICADDVLLPDFMQRMSDALAEASAPSFSYCLPEFIDKDGNLPKVALTAPWLAYLNYSLCGIQPFSETRHACVCTPYVFNKYKGIFGLTGSVGGKAQDYWWVIQHSTAPFKR